MINDIYVTVQNVLNKDSRGYITPQEFNNYAKLAQLSIFEDMFHEYAKAIDKQNARMYYSEYSDIPAQLREVIDIFSINDDFIATQGSFEIQDLNFYRLIQIYTSAGREVEEISKTELNALLRNELVSPTRDFPVFIRTNGQYRVYPNSITQLNVFYIRKPKDPKWTYFTVGNNTLFNPSANDYQDFEMPYTQYNSLLMKILLYCGVQIREQEVAQMVAMKEQEQTNKEQL